MTPADFVTAYLGAAHKNERDAGVPALLTLAQAALESGWGAHAPGFNFFGVKADASWTGERQTLRTREVVGGVSVMQDASFRKYPNPTASFADHAAFLRRWARYAKVFETSDPREAARAVAAAGYATDPNYAASLIRIIGMIEAELRAGAPPQPRPWVEPQPEPRRGWLSTLLSSVFGGRA